FNQRCSLVSGIYILGHNHVCNIGISDSILIALVFTFAKIRAHIVYAFFDYKTPNFRVVLHYIIIF
ncbi:MAG: hypothetical protein KAX18_13955, partial [Candidatus Lokiarchaeota archaeon]|nr:hypothetical protein [Candidatus Lokiarchaeota archaeon]